MANHAADRAQQRSPDVSSSSSASNNNSSCAIDTPIYEAERRGDSLLNRSHRMACRKLILASLVCIIFMIIEIIAGLLANSLALLSDASHLLSDTCSFFISLFAIWVSAIKGNANMSFGYHRAEIIGALVSVMLIWGVTGILVYEAIFRLFAPPHVNGRIMFITAVFGTLANVFMTHILKVHSHSMINPDHCSHSPTPNVAPSDHTCDLMLGHSLLDKEEAGGAVAVCEEEEVYGTEPDVVNINLRAAYIHALGDLLQNVGVMIAAGLIWWDSTWCLADPICTLLFSIFVVYTTAAIIKESLNVLMEGSPGGIDIDGLTRDLLGIDDVVDVHDLHVWSLSVGKPALACHLVVLQEQSARAALTKATTLCQRSYGILHTTIQTDYSANKSCCDTVAHQKCGS